MLKIIDKMPLLPLLVFGVLLALAPMQPEPHLVEKLRMLSEGMLSKPIDVFDLLMHGLPPLLLIAKIARIIQIRSQDKAPTEE